MADLNFVFATTARERGQGKVVMGPPEAGQQMQQRVAHGERVGIIFGRERTGLENDDIAMAEAEIKRSDHANATRMHEQFGVNWGDPVLFDLVERLRLTTPAKGKVGTQV